MRILITEEALETVTGHWPSYIGDLASAFREQGDEVTVLTHRRAGEALLQRVGGTPWYSRNCWRDSRSQGKFGGVIHNVHFYRETLRHLREAKPYDCILAPTMRLQHLVAFAVLSRQSGVPERSRFILLFVQGFGRYAGPGKETSFPGGVSTRMARAAFRWMAPAVKRGRVTLAGETAGMCRELQRFTGLPATLFPHPVNFIDPLPLAQRDRREGTTGDSRFTVTCPGVARYEKGTDLLQEAILRVLAGPLAAKFRFVLQWPEPFGLPDGGQLEPCSQLKEHPSVELINRNLDAAAYHELLKRTDFVILPYRSEAYHQRLSRVAIEAAGRGIPFLYTAHTWIAEVAELTGSGIRIERETHGAIVEALETAAERAVELADAAAKGARAVREFHSASTFHKLLQG